MDFRQGGFCATATSAHRRRVLLRRMTTSCDTRDEHFTTGAGNVHVHTSPEWRSWGMAGHVGHVVDCSIAHLLYLQQRGKAGVRAAN